jgi:multidrug efflux pump subunit AcrA (membrane-fusion protein)
MRNKLFLVVGIMLFLSLAVWGAFEVYQRSAPEAATGSAVPTTIVKRGDVIFSVAAKGELQGGNSETLMAPMTGGREMVLTQLKDPGELVEADDVVARFDTTEQEYALMEAEADLAEAEQQVIKARAETAAKAEESSYDLIHAKAQVRLAELETRKNELVAAIQARQNDLALEAARDRLNQLEHDLANRQATNEAAIAIQEAAKNKAGVRAATAKTNIEAMTLRTKSGGYVAVQQNTRSNFMYWGMQLPIFQVGDTVRAGMPVVQIPDLENWEITARIGELDRGHLETGQPVVIRVIAVPENEYHGKLKEIGGTTGPPWDRHFQCKVSLQNPSPDLRQGMSARITINTGQAADILWVPSQALFESDGRTFVYEFSGTGFTPRDVELVRRSDSQVVLKGIDEGRLVALASPDQQSSDEENGGALEALPSS